MITLIKYCCSHSLCVCVCGLGKEEGESLFFTCLTCSEGYTKLTKHKREKRECHCKLLLWEKATLGCVVGTLQPCLHQELSNCTQWALTDRQDAAHNGFDWQPVQRSGYKLPGNWGERYQGDICHSAEAEDTCVPSMHRPAQTWSVTCLPGWTVPMHWSSNCVCVWVGACERETPLAWST